MWLNLRYADLADPAPSTEPLAERGKRRFDIRLLRRWKNVLRTVRG